MWSIVAGLFLVFLGGALSAEESHASRSLPKSSKPAKALTASKALEVELEGKQQKLRKEFEANV